MTVTPDAPPGAPIVIDGRGAPEARLGWLRRADLTTVRVWVLTAVMSLGSLALFVTVLGRLRAPLEKSPLIGLALVLLFVAAEVFVVHIKFYRESQTFSLSEIGLVIGLFFAPVWVLLAATIVGCGTALVVHRKQPPVKLAFNLASLALTTLAGVGVFHAIGPGTDPLGRAWVAALGAVLTSSIVGVLTVFSVIAISEGSMKKLNPGPHLLFGMVLELVTGSLGLIAVTVMRVHSFGVLLVLVPVAGLYMANVAYIREREKNESLQFLYDSTRLLNQSPELTSAIASMLAQARETVGADVAALSYLPNDGAKLVQNCVGPGTSTHLMREVDMRLALPLWDRVASTGASLHITEEADAAMVSAMLPGVTVRNGWVVPLRGESRINGVMVVANHIRTVGGFNVSDVRLLETLAGHLSVALENGRLEQSLAELRSLQEELTYAATHDSLTRLPNRALFSDTTTRAVEARSADMPVAVLFVDLDDFKTVNDSLGHAAGDELLIVVSQRIGACLRGGDFAARLGGDEFAVLVRDASDADAPVQVAKRIIASLSAPIGLSAGQVRVGASVGLAVSSATDTAQSLMRNADMAMYRAKELGKGRWAAFTPDMHEAAVRRQDLTSDLLSAIEDGQLEVHLQPLVDLHRGRLLGAEALVRWDHPRLGRLSPDTFISIAEESGNIGALTRYVLHESCRLAMAWPAPDAGRWEGVVSVNLSARDFDDGDLVLSVRRTLETTGLPAERLMLEITESLMLGDPRSTAAQLEGLAALGVRIALDDFGTGYSSLSQLGRLPLGWVKIAKPFVDDIGIDARGEAIVRAIVDLGTALGVRVIAEGIETAEQLAVLQRLGADVGQGFYISRPLTPAGFTGWLDGRLGQVLPLAPAASTGAAPADVVAFNRPRGSWLAADRAG